MAQLMHLLKETLTTLRNNDAITNIPNTLEINT